MSIVGERIRPVNVKKLWPLMLTVLLLGSLPLAGCSAQSTPSHAIGDSVESDIMGFTLDAAEPTVAVENSGAATFGPGSDGLAKEDYFLPKEYDPEVDKDNPYVAAKGHTLVHLTFTASNLDRDYVEVGDDLFTVRCNGGEYSFDFDTFKLGAVSTTNAGWVSINTTNDLMEVGDTSTYRCYVDIPVDIDELGDGFEVVVNLPNSEGETTPFVYQVDGK